jgi:hypothetical protein
VAPELAQPASGGTDGTVYVVTYFNGVTEEATGLDQVRRLLIDPSSRVEGGQSVMQGGTYFPKE